MNGIIVYDDASLKKNEFFAKKLTSELSALGLSTKVVLPHEAENEKVDFAVMRVYDERVSRLLESGGVRVINSAFVSSICNDKWKTFEFYRGKGIPLAPTQRAEECDLSFPRIVKARHGHGGSEVFFASNGSEFDRIVSSCRDEMIVQPPVGIRGRDLRVYVIGGKPIVAMLRSSDVDFRSNFSLGGRAERHELSGEELALVDKVYSLLCADFIGIDFIPSENGLILNEIEDVVGCRMVYTYTNIDIIKLFAEHIEGTLRRK